MQQNVLVTSISKKVPLLQAVKYALQKSDFNAILIGGDADSKCTGKYFVDEFWHMPKITNLEIEELVRYCKAKGIVLILPTRDGELLYFARHKEQLEEQGIHVMISNERAVTICLDKQKFYDELSACGYPVITTTQDIEQLEGERYVVKERYGAGSQSIGLDLLREEAVAHAKHLSSPIFQPYIEGEEVSVDMYIDAFSQVKGVIVRKRELVVHGESQVSTTFRHQEIEELCAQMASDMNLYGHVIFQGLLDEDGMFHVIECNPRFGGASSLSLVAGLDSFYWCYLEALKKNITYYPFVRSEGEKKLVRYACDLIIDV
ncbi:carbamoyl phosphate synthase [Aneurinibacillus danicus]|uniref:Carbamoyl phosphate synthase n=2 Tax=Aneurinibacillus danicus TaxID=267746 RepID=A0A511VBI8_9BACL|nr:carbamoyl phosphate synthase [Aneurinibacillus danicus]